MTELYTDPRVKLELTRCFECGRWWAYEVFRAEAAECPVCARRQLERMRDAVAERDRSIAALRGSLTKRKREAT